MSHEYDDSLEDERYDDEVVRAMDDEAEAREIEAKRNAAGMSTEELALLDTYNEGQRVGAQGGGAGLNPWRDPSSPEFKTWERGRSAAEAYRLSRQINQRRAA